MRFGVLGRRDVPVARVLFSVEAGGERGVGDFDGEGVGIKLVADPLASFGVFRMSGIEEDFEQVLVAPGTTAIFWRTVALSGEASG